MHGATQGPLPTDAARRQRHARPERRVLTSALTISILLHVALFYLFTFDIDMAPETEAPRVQPLVRIVPAMQVYDLVEVAGEAAPIAVQIEERRRSETETDRGRQQGEPQSPVAGDRNAGAELDPTAVRDRLRYRMAPQVWQPPSEERLAELTPQEIVAQRLASQLAEYNDSVAAEAAARERAVDWTKRDADGGRWGVSPGKIHLGSVTLPLPVGFSAPGRPEFAQRTRTWAELQEQASRVEANESFKDRVKSINERMERQRSGGATAADSTRVVPPAGSSGGGSPSGSTGNSGND